ncbi:hypothetical protein [Sphingomonas sp. TREG-RG-20F-R18-01]|uniref:hypothetical protein n=1 Tax=Sphingomonas sp. TREG-RG-20F-R18-01 TaxID=2914982 RepID=UPI001F58FD4F|nr:hypothetical protein [Sphingomonas sp. TREG-RG-20F-R18-01]
MRKIILAASILAFAAGTAPALAAPCKDAKGRFMKCATATPKPTRCRLNGKFAKCGTPGAKPA